MDTYSNDILVSIDCITYNHSAYIKQALDGFLLQKTNFAFEILVHDDGSTDGTSQIIMEYQKKYPDIVKAIIQDENQYSKGIKRLDYLYNIKRAKGKYIAACEGDDYWTDPYKLQKQIDYLENHSECGFCFHGVKIVENNCITREVFRPYEQSQNTNIIDVIYRKGGFVPSNSLVYVKRLMDNPPEFYFSSPVGDYPMQIFLALQSKGYYMDEVMSVYRFNAPGSWTFSLIKGKHPFERQININTGLMLMLKNVDEYSHGIYTNTIQKTITDLEFSNLMLKKKFRKLKEPKYRTIYYSIPLYKRIKMKAEYLFPELYAILARAKSFCCRRRLIVRK